MRLGLYFGWPRIPKLLKPEWIEFTKRRQLAPGLGKKRNRAAGPRRVVDAKVGLLVHNGNPAINAVAPRNIHVLE